MKPKFKMNPKMVRKLADYRKRNGKRKLRVQRLVRQIAARLFTVSHGTKDAEKGTRLAVMKGKIPHETHLGGWCRSAAEREIASVLSNAEVSHGGDNER